MAAEPEENITVDLDLKADDARLRESVGEPTTVRIDGVVVHILNIAEWNGAAMKAASAGDWDKWADQVIDDDDELKVFQDADLMNYQLEAVFEACADHGNLNPGKSKRSGKSSRPMRRR
jgi:hypothetical protein